MPIKLRGNHQFLNFAPRKVLWRYRTSEHMFQALKATTKGDHDYVANAPTAKKAKERGQEIKLRDDWEDVKYPAMIAVLILKFIAHPDLRDELVETGWEPIEEDRKDPEWGARNNGKNLMGHALMRVRQFFYMNTKEYKRRKDEYGRL